MAAIAEKLLGLQNAIIGTNVPQLVQYIISYALELGTSDIHIEPQETTVQLRYRIDGALQLIVEYPVSLHSAVVSRIKIMSNLKIDETRVPQDGRASVTTKDGRDMDLRVSTLPTVNGEKVVMRLQDKSRTIPTLEQLGIEGRNKEVILRSINAPNGVVLTTGPTGSGKTTTLYSCLNLLNQTDVNIMTIEDPVEIQMPGLNQTQTHHDIGYTFATGLRAALRQDPDIIMVGEIRDKETADIALEASLTGHLVLSTLHTNSAVATLTRLLDMDVPDYLLVATINCIIAQRLARRICPHCKTEAEMTPAIEAKLRKAISTMNEKERAAAGLADENAPLKIYHGTGCEKCNGLGYKGRVGFYEVMEMNNALRELIIKKESSVKIEEAAVSFGMKTLEHDGVLKVLEGITTPEEVYAVAQHQD